MIRIVMLPMLAAIITLTTLYSSVAQLVGRWTAMEDMDCKPKAIIEIFEADGKLHGHVEEALPDAATTICAKCDGDLKGKPIPGTVILKDLVITENGAKDAKILGPSGGNTYS